MTNERDDVAIEEEDVEKEDSTDLEHDLQDFEDVLVAPSDWTISSLLHLLNGKIDLDPEFQRRNVWSKAAKSRYIESIFLNIPIPQILLAANKKDKNKMLVLDGKQRLLAIKQFFDGKLDDEKKFKLTGLRLLKDLEGKTWEQIKNDEKWSDNFLNYPQRTTVMKGWTKEGTLYEIFYRLNSGSVKLSAMELMMSLHRGEFLKFLINWTETIRPIHGLLKLSSPDKRMADVELTIKYLAFMEPAILYEGNLKVYLDNLSKHYNKQHSDDWITKTLLPKLAEFGSAIEAAQSIFGVRDVCRKYKGNKFEGRFNRAVFDIIIGSLSNKLVRDWALENKALFKQAFIDVSSNDPIFVNSFETSTKNLEPTTHRFKTWYSKVSEISGHNLTLPNIKTNDS